MTPQKNTLAWKHKKHNKKKTKNAISLKQQMVANTNRQRNKPTSHDLYKRRGR